MASDRYPFGAHERLHIIYESLAKMARAEIAAMIVIAEHANSQTGETFVSQCTIAKRGGMTTRSATRTIAKLVNDGIITVEPRSGRTSIIKMIKPPTPMSGLDADAPPTLVSTPLDADVGTPPTPVSYEPLSETGTIPVLRKDRGGTETLPGAVSAANGKDKYPDFWQAFPVRSTVADAEQMIAELVAAGVPLHEIIEGARRYQKYNAATASKHRQSAKQWLARQAWRDDWTLPQKATKKENITRLRGDFDLAGSDRKKLTDLSCRLEGKITGHLWGKGQEPEDAYSDSARELALCKLCYAYLYEYQGEPCDTMADIIELQDDVDKRLMGEA